MISDLPYNRILVSGNPMIGKKWLIENECRNTDNILMFNNDIESVRSAVLASNFADSIVVICDVDKKMFMAQDAILKALEESRSRFIVTSHDYSSLEDTILSRFDKIVHIEPFSDEYVAGLTVGKVDDLALSVACGVPGAYIRMMNVQHWHDFNDYCVQYINNKVSILSKLPYVFENYKDIDEAGNIMNMFARFYCRQFPSSDKVAKLASVLSNIVKFELNTKVYTYKLFI